MAATGVSVDDAVISEFNDIKLGRTKAKFIIYKIDGTFVFSFAYYNVSESFFEPGFNVVVEGSLPERSRSLPKAHHTHTTHTSSYLKTRPAHCEGSNVSRRHL